eukprot:3511868-Rhodomonas_salina.3
MICNLKEKLAEISAQVACEQAMAQPNGNSSLPGGKTPKAGTKYLLKTGQSAIAKIRGKSPSTPCTTCCKLHRGKCIHLHHLDKEQQEVYLSRKLKAAIATALRLLTCRESGSWRSWMIMKTMTSIPASLLSLCLPQLESMCLYYLIPMDNYSTAIAASERGASH